MRVVGSPDSILDWHPQVERISMFEKQGLLYRKSFLSGSEAELIEKLWRDEGASEYHFQAVQGLWADFRYRSKIVLKDCLEGCKVAWEGRLLAGDADKVDVEQLDSFYREGLRGMNELLERN